MTIVSVWYTFPEYAPYNKPTEYYEERYNMTDAKNPYGEAIRKVKAEHPGCMIVGFNTYFPLLYPWWTLFSAKDDTEEYGVQDLSTMTDCNDKMYIGYLIGDALI